MPRTATILGLSVAMLAGAALAACQSPVHRNRFHEVGDPPSFFNGSMTYKGDETIPEGSTVTARLLDVSDPNSAPVVIATDSYKTHPCTCASCTCGSKMGKCTCDAMARPPFGFFIRFDPTQVPPGGTYAVDGSIMDPSGRVLYASGQPKVISPNERIEYFDMPLKEH